MRTTPNHRLIDPVRVQKLFRRDYSRLKRRRRIEAGVDMYYNGVTAENSAAMLGNVTGVIGSAGQLKLKSCFAAGTPLLWEFGSKAIEEFRVGERVWSRHEDNATGSLELKVIEETFVWTGQILHLHVGNQVIRTTLEHPFYVRGKGWREGGSLEAGDLLASNDGRWVAVTDLLDTGEYETGEEKVLGPFLKGS